MYIKKLQAAYEYWRFRLSVGQTPLRLIDPQGSHAEVPVVANLDEVETALNDPHVVGVVWRRSDELYEQIKARLENEALKITGKAGSSIIFPGCSDKGVSRREALLLVGIKEESIIQYIQRDLNTIDDFLLRRLPSGKELVSLVGTSLYDPRGIHIDSGSDVLAVVSYLGMGTGYILFDELTESSKVKAQAGMPMHLLPESEVFGTLVPPFWVFFQKGRKDLQRKAVADNPGLPHFSAFPWNPVFGFHKRLTAVSFDRACG